MNELICSLTTDIFGNQAVLYDLQFRRIFYWDLCTNLNIWASEGFQLISKRDEMNAKRVDILLFSMFFEIILNEWSHSWDFRSVFLRFVFFFFFYSQKIYEPKLKKSNEKKSIGPPEKIHENRLKGIIIEKNKPKTSTSLQSKEFVMLLQCHTQIVDRRNVFIQQQTIGWFLNIN